MCLPVSLAGKASRFLPIGINCIREGHRRSSTWKRNLVSRSEHSYRKGGSIEQVKGWSGEVNGQSMPKTGLYRNAPGLGSPQGEPWQTSGVGPSRLNSKKSKFSEIFIIISQMFKWIIQMLVVVILCSLKHLGGSIEWYEWWSLIVHRPCPTSWLVPHEYSIYYWFQIQFFFSFFFLFF